TWPRWRPRTCAWSRACRRTRTPRQRPPTRRSTPDSFPTSTRSGRCTPDASQLHELPNGTPKMSKPFIGATEYFPGIGAIPYEGPISYIPLKFKLYDANKVLGGKTMRHHLRFAVCYWHTFCNSGADPFGPGTRRFPWEKGDAMATAEAKVDA